MRTYQVSWIGVTAILSLAPLLATGCSSTGSNTTNGAVAGGAVGTGVGLLAGAVTHHPLVGAAIGGLAGAGIGAAAGANEDSKERAQVRQTNAAIATAQAQAQQSRLGMMDIVKMVQSNQSDEVIISQIRATGSTFQLSANDLDYLKNGCHVPDSVILAMQNARPQPILVAQPPQVIYGPPPVVYGPPPGVVVVGGYRRW